MPLNFLPSLLGDTALTAGYNVPLRPFILTPDQTGLRLGIHDNWFAQSENSDILRTGSLRKTPVVSGLVLGIYTPQPI